MTADNVGISLRGETLIDHEVTSENSSKDRTHYSNEEPVLKSQSTVIKLDNPENKSFVNSDDRQLENETQKSARSITRKSRKDRKMSKSSRQPTL